MSFPTFSRLACATGVTILAGSVLACHPDSPLAADPPDAQRTTISCRARLSRPEIVCGGATGGQRNLILGGQGTYLRLASTGTGFNPETRILSSSVTIQNLLAGPMGTHDGTTVYGLRVLFHEGPSVTVGAGTVLVSNPDGVGTFTAAGQPYYLYQEILPPGGTSIPREWRFYAGPGVDEFAFSLYVETRLPVETGVLRWTQRSLCDSCSLSRLWHPGGDTLLAVGRRGVNGLVLRSFDAGASWNEALVTQADESLSMVEVSGSGPTFFALGATSGGVGVYRSADAGASWQPVPGIPTAQGADIVPATLWARGDTVVIAGVGDADCLEGICWDRAPRLLRSTDGLLTHTLLALPHRYQEDPRIGSIWGASSGALYVTKTVDFGYATFLYRITHDVASWSLSYELRPDLGSATLTRVWGLDAGAVWLIRHISGVGGAVLLSTDQGTTWAQEALPPASFIAVWAPTSESRYAVSTDMGLFRYEAGTWWRQPASLPGAPLDLAGTSNQNVFILLGQGTVLHGTR